MSRFGIIGDVHAEDDALELALSWMQTRGVSTICCVGDIVDGKGNVDRCCQLLRANNVITVRGNHERWYLEQSMRTLTDATVVGSLQHDTEQYLASLPLTHELVTTRGQLLLCHGLDKNDMAKFLPDDFGYSIQSNDHLTALCNSPYQFVVNGHSHRRMVRKHQNRWFINAGTLFREHTPSFGMVDFTDNSITWCNLHFVANPKRNSSQPMITSTTVERFG